MQACQRSVDLGVHLVRREAALVVVGHRPEELRRQDVRAARIGREDIAPGLLRGPATVHVRGVEEVDARVERRPGAGLGALPAYTPGVGQPRPQGDLRDSQVAAAQLAVLHRRPPQETGLSVTLYRARPWTKRCLSDEREVAPEPLERVVRGGE